MFEALWLLWLSLFHVGRRLNYIPDVNDGTDYTQFIINVPHTTSFSTITETFTKKNIDYDNLTQNPHVPDLIGELRDGNKDDDNSKPYDWLKAESRPLKDLFDVVILTGTLTSTTKERVRVDYSGWLSFFETWKPILEDINIIIMQQGDPTIHIEVPSWLEFELYTKLDVQKTLGDLAWIVDMNESDSSSARSFAFMASDKDYIFVLDRFMVPMIDVSTGKLVNVLEGHLQQLLTPSDPYYFNSFDDPYQRNNDFVRGYPYLLRGGTLTGLSQGQPMKPMDYDAATQLIKPSLNDGHHHHHPNHTHTSTSSQSQPNSQSHTIPHGMMFSLTGSNFAFNRLATAPIMYFLPAQLAHDWGYDIGEKNINIMTGWMVKTVLDYVRLGVKNGGDTSMTPVHTPTYSHDDSNDSSSYNHVVHSLHQTVLLKELKYDHTWVHCPNASLDRVHRWYRPYHLDSPAHPPLLISPLTTHNSPLLSLTSH